MKENKPLFFIESAFYACATVLFICTIRLSIYSPVILSSQFNLFNTDITAKKILGNPEIYKSSLVFSDLGLGNPALLISFVLYLAIGLLIYSFFRECDYLKRVWKNFLMFNLTVFGILITLFSIWGN